MSTPFGVHLLFIGTESYNWDATTFKQAALFAKAHGTDCFLVKAGEGTDRWYGGLGGWHQRRDACRSVGVNAIAYWYSIGNTLGGLAAEIATMVEYLKADGVFCADMEAEWNGKTDWAQSLRYALSSVSGTFLCSTWGDPVQQAWVDVMNIIAPVTDYFMPQQYSNWLAGQWGQFGGKKLIPTLHMTGVGDPNDPLNVALAAYQQKHDALSVWHYGLAMNDPVLLDAIWKQFPGKKVIDVSVYDKNLNIKKEFDDCWASTSKLTGGVLNKSTGIHRSWVEYWLGGYQFGPPITDEYKSCDGTGKAIICQQFAGGRCEWDGDASWYGPHGAVML